MDKKDVNIQSPTVELENNKESKNSISLKPELVHLSIKDAILNDINNKVRNGVVAYLGNIEYKIIQCIDFFYSTSNAELDEKKATSSALAAGCSCVILEIETGGLFICIVKPEILYSAVKTIDVSSSSYGGLTFMETRGKSYIANLKTKWIITADHVVLYPDKREEDYIPRNAYFRRQMELSKTIQKEIYVAQLNAYQTIKK